MARPQRKLVIVSNRGPYRAVTRSGKRVLLRAAGGLVAALDPVLRARGGTWISAAESDTPKAAAGDPQLEYNLASVPLSRAEREGFYQGVSNAVLWPILHSMPSTIRIGQAPWSSYEHANRAFCDVVLANSRVGDVVWVQDFHLMLLPRMLRQKRARARLGWFCHIPWPGRGVFDVLPRREEIIQGLLGADVVGFQTESYCRNFLACVEDMTDLRVDHARMIVRDRSRTVRVVSAPIGVPVDEIQTLASDPSMAAEVEKIKRSVNGRRIILGVDRLDYTKGIPERLLAFEQLLRSDPSARNRYVLVQVMVPSRTDVQAYARLKDDIDRLVGDINGRYSRTGQVPIHYLYRNLDQPRLYTLYLAAEVALVTPLRDGMNLVAQEYVAARVHGGGVLILSEFAGAAEYLDDALMVNPYDSHALAAALKKALSMSTREANRRMNRLRVAVHKLDVHRWADEFVQLIEKAV